MYWKIMDLGENIMLAEVVVEFEAVGSFDDVEVEGVAVGCWLLAVSC